MPLAEYKQNLGLLIDRLQALGAQVVVITPAPIDEAARRKLNQEVGHSGGNSADSQPDKLASLLPS